MSCSNFFDLTGMQRSFYCLPTFSTSSFQSCSQEPLEHLRWRTLQQWLTAKPLTIVTTFFILDVCGGPGNNRNSRKRCSIKKSCSEENFPIFREKKPVLKSRLNPSGLQLY